MYKSSESPGSNHVSVRRPYYLDVQRRGLERVHGVHHAVHQRPLPLGPAGAAPLEASAARDLTCVRWLGWDQCLYIEVGAFFRWGAGHPHAAGAVGAGVIARFAHGQGRGQG